MKRFLAPVAAALGILLVAVSAPAVANAATVGASDASSFSVDQSSRDVALPVVSTANVGAVRIAIDFEKDGPQCVGFADDNPYHNETQFQLRSPAGTTVTLIASGTYAGASTQRVLVTLDDAAPARVGGGEPVRGTFRPSSPLAAFAGQPAGGTWVLTVTDTVGSDPLCYFGSTLTIDEAAPVLPAGALPRGTEGVAYSAQLPAATASGAVTYAVVDPAALPPGLTVQTSGAVVGTPTVSGTYVFSVTASDAIGTSQPRSYTIVVEGPPSISGAASAAATNDVAFSYAPVVDDGERAATVTAEGLPSGLTVSPTTGVISGSPTALVGRYGVLLTIDNGLGTDEHAVVVTVGAGAVASLTLSPLTSRIAENASIAFGVTAQDAGANPVPADGVTLTTDGADDAVDGLTVVFGDPGQRTVTATHGATGVTTTATVSVLPAPVVPPGTLPVARVGEAYAATLPAAIAEGDDVTYALAEGSALPAGLTLSDDGTIAGTPTTFGAASFDVTATDEFGTSEAETFSIEVQAPPAITGAATASATRDAPFSYEPALVAGQPAASVTAAGLPDGLVVDAASGAITGEPTDAPGTYAVTLTATNAVGADEHTVTITLVAGAAAQLALTPSATQVSQGGTVTFEVTAVDDDGYATDASDVTLSTGVEGDEVAQTQDAITFGAPGTRTVTATSASTSATTTATIEVIAPPTLPAGELPNGIVGDAYAAALPAPTTTGDWTIEAVDAEALPPGIVLDETGTLAGTPTEAGTFTFAATVTDRFGTSEETTFTIVVQQRAAISGEATAVARIGEPFAYAPDLEPGDPAATVTTPEQLPAWLSLDAATGELTGTPTGALGEVIVTLVADNGLGSDSHVVTIDVVPGVVATLALTPAATTIDQGGSVTFEVSGADVEGNAVDVTDEVALTSDVATDAIDGLRVTFPTASAHTITATHESTGVTATAVVEVVPAPTVTQPTPSAPGVTAPPPTQAGTDLPRTGAELAGTMMLVALAAMLLVAGVVLGLRRRR
ncbi:MULTISPECIES: putative Ig domain-containing protein [unclassified Agrococcus]|uniref:putative Ig domain-containing protein n=1 Tax=unclassified Agrococcus TaxID=2615065 RepID=UPI00361EA694